MFRGASDREFCVGINLMGTSDEDDDIYKQFLENLQTYQ